MVDVINANQASIGDRSGNLILEHDEDLCGRGACDTDTLQEAHNCRDRTQSK